MMLVSSTPETTNPVADACEAAGMPCISTVTPYQPWYLARDPPPDPGKPKPYQWTWHFFWGLEDIIGVFADMWSQVENNHVLGGLWPNDGDGKAWSVGFPKVLRNQGYRIVDPDRYQNEKNSFAAEIETFKAEGADIVTGVPLPPTSPPSGCRRPTGTTGPRSPRSARRCCSRRSSRPWAAAPRASPPRSGGAPAPVHLVADRRQRRPAGHRLPEPDGPAVDPADRLRARPVRGGGLGAPAGRRRRRQAGPGRRHQGHQPAHDRRHRGLDPRPGRLPQRLQDPAGRGPVAPGR